MSEDDTQNICLGTDLRICLVREFPNQKEIEITPAFLKKNIVEAITQLYGEVSAAVTVDILKYNLTSKEAIIRVPKTHYIKLRNSLTLACKYEGQSCIYKVHRASPLLLALQAESRSYQH